MCNYKEMKEYSQVYSHDMNGNDIEWQQTV